ncbi:hypothetical protein EMIT0373P_10471 [Pseudomonas chlororaphis]
MTSLELAMEAPSFEHHTPITSYSLMWKYKSIHQQLLKSCYKKNTPQKLISH